MSFRSHHGGQYNEEDECNLLLRKFRDTMRDGGWKSKTSTSGWKVSKEQGRTRAVSEYQRDQSARLSAPKRMSGKYEEELDRCRKTFYGK